MKVWARLALALISVAAAAVAWLVVIEVIRRTLGVA
jgi:hypothetical protein